MTRTATRAVVAVGILLLVAACSSAPPPSETPTLAPTRIADVNASPETSPTADADPPPEFRDREAEMTDAEAIERLDNPQTRELWLTQPRSVPTPAWARGDALLDSSDTSWWELGRRGSASIMGVGYPALEEFFEVDAEGVWRWIAFPSPRDRAIADPSSVFADSGVATEVHVYYDTLALPDAFSLTTGEQLFTPFEGRGMTSLPPEAVLATATTIMHLGDYEVVRYERPVAWVWSQAYEVSRPESVTYRDVFYVLEAPYGLLIPLRFSPFGILEDVTWDRSTTFAPDAYLVDLNDIACGPYDTDHNTIAIGVTDADWVSAGLNARGEPVYVPAADNPLVQPMYDVYREHRGASAVSLESFIGAPALVGFYSRDNAGWVVSLNAQFSGRTWC